MTKTIKDLALPRILCLHGGGVNAHIFRLQCRTLLTSPAAAHFRFVFVDGPEPCEAHPAVQAVYGDFGPFYRWLRFEPEHPLTDAGDAAYAILACCRAAMTADPGTGKWVGVLGFSQGAKVAASLLWLAGRERERGRLGRQADQEGEAGKTGGGGKEGEEAGDVSLPVLGTVNFCFGVLLAGSAPPAVLDPEEAAAGNFPRHIDDPEGLTAEFKDWPERNEGEHVIRGRTLHVHGLKDPGTWRHRIMLEKYCKEGTTKVVEWDGGHRLPFKSADVGLVADGILEMGRDTGVLER
ncbi:serine hydrolase FSH [Lasiosphaeria hispida]|uniref:Serine hydrolase FSH n=1 Tax=Lasiosphaeria hispida TaxID=260671 RepID=A0AAJ0H824_9PEZI|nr:serine hydrolase FSH [Lasiosphaeria hispida]